MNVGKFVIVITTGNGFVAQELKSHGAYWSFPSGMGDNGWAMELEELPKGTQIILSF